jgi:hypothetical protein
MLFLRTLSAVTRKGDEHCEFAATARPDRRRPAHVRHPPPRWRGATVGDGTLAPVHPRVRRLRARDACGGRMATRRRGPAPGGIGACAKVGRPPHALAFLERRARPGGRAALAQIGYAHQGPADRERGGGDEA